MNEELDSQLSAMFDNELPAAECELLARRLSRDEELKARWGRYAAIGATIRAEGGVRLNTQLALRVNAAISGEPAVIAQPEQRLRPPASMPRWAPVSGVAIAASVAAAAILWVRFQSPQESTAHTPVAGIPGVGAGGQIANATNVPDSYVVPKSIPRRFIVPSTQLANYVVAHSEFSSPVNRRNLLSTLMVSESGTAGTPSGSEETTEDVNDDGKSPQ